LSSLNSKANTSHLSNKSKNNQTITSDGSSKLGGDKPVRKTVKKKRSKAEEPKFKSFLEDPSLFKDQDQQREMYY